MPLHRSFALLRAWLLLLVLLVAPLARAATTAPAMTHADSLHCPRCVDSLSVEKGGPTLQLTGLLSRIGGQYVIDGCGGRTVLESIMADSLVTHVGHRVWANVLCTGAGRAAALGGHALGDSVVDLWVMGFCPFARGLESQIDSLRTANLAVPPLRLHWIFYATDSADTRLYHSLHGPRELAENVVQAGIQELSPAQLWPYLADRAHSDDDWRTVAGRAGVPWNVVSELQRRLDRELVARARAAFEDMTLNWPHIDGSPTVCWLGHEVRSINSVPGFKAAKPSAEHCQNR